MRFPRVVSAPEAEGAPVAEPPRKAKPKAKAKAAPAKPAAKAKGKAKAKAPRQRDPAKLDEFGLRKESLKSRAAAMYAAKGGATLGEVKAKLDSTQFNVLKELEEGGCKIDRKQEDGKGNRQITRYFLKRAK